MTRFMVRCIIVYEKPEYGGPALSTATIKSLVRIIFGRPSRIRSVIFFLFVRARLSAFPTTHAATTKSTHGTMTAFNRLGFTCVRILRRKGGLFHCHICFGLGFIHLGQI